jgi:Fe-S-cluster containining protein
MIRGSIPDSMIAEDGSCVHLRGNQCSVYETRPTMCRIDEMIDRMGHDRQSAYDKTAAICNRWMDEDGFDESKRIPLPVVQRPSACAGPFVP